MNQIQNQIVITDTFEFEEIIKILKESLSRISDNFGQEEKLMTKIDNTDIWTGEVQEKVYSKYMELSKCHNPIVESLNTYIKFLENTVNSYKQAEETINNNINENIDNLNVN